MDLAVFSIMELIVAAFDAYRFWYPIHFIQKFHRFAWVWLQFSKSDAFRLQ